MAVHTIKILPQFFEAVADGSKRFEIRKNDRGYQRGDIAYMEEIDYDRKTNKPYHTGRVVKVMIGYVTNYLQKEDIVVFSVILLPPDESMKNDRVSNSSGAQQPVDRGADKTARDASKAYSEADKLADGKNRNGSDDVGPGKVSS